MAGVTSCENALFIKATLLFNFLLVKNEWLESQTTFTAHLSYRSLHGVISFVKRR